MVEITLEGDTLVYRSGYHAGLVAALKSLIPASERRWDATRKAWLIAPQHGATLAELTEKYLGTVVAVPQVEVSTNVRETRIFEVRYIGSTKNRGDGNPVAFGWVNGEWAVVFPERVLREWFNAKQQPDEFSTLYAVLGVTSTATDAEIKAAYRRLARTWHPDVCHEPDAAEQFKRINHAYELISNPIKRAKYDAGLAFEQSLRSSRKLTDSYTQGTGYRSPLRCGLIMVEGCETLGRFIVEKIIAWQDIIDAQGHVLISSWPVGARQPVEVWR